MANTIKPRPLEHILNDFRKAGLSEASVLFMRDVLNRVEKALTNLGQIQSVAPVTGRTEGIGTTVTNITATGTFNSLDNVDNTNTDFLTDGTGSPIAGGKRGFVALDTNNRLAGTFRNNLVNVQGFFTSTNPLSQSGVSTTILVASSTKQFGDGTVSYNSGSVDPGVLGGYTIYTDDATFAGGAVTYSATQANQNLTASNGRTTFGSITTLGGGGGSGSGGGDGEFPPLLIV